MFYDKNGKEIKIRDTVNVINVHTGYVCLFGKVVEIDYVRDYSALIKGSWYRVKNFGPGIQPLPLDSGVWCYSSEIELLPVTKIVGGDGTLIIEQEDAYDRVIVEDATIIGDEPQRSNYVSVLEEEPNPLEDIYEGQVITIGKEQFYVREITENEVILRSVRG